MTPFLLKRLEKLGFVPGDSNPDEWAVSKIESLSIEIDKLKRDLLEVESYWTECSERLDWLEDELEISEQSSSHVLWRYHDRFDLVHEEAIHFTRGNSRPVITKRNTVKDSARAPMICDTCGNDISDGSFETIMTPNLAGVVMCQKCLSMD